MLLFATRMFAASAIGQIDFKNFVYPWPGESATPGQWLRKLPTANIALIEGEHHFEVDGASARLISVTYGDVTGDGEDEAMIDLRYSTGGTGNWHYLYVYTSAGRSARPIGILMSGGRAYGGLAGVGVSKGLLYLDFNDGDRAEGECCSRGTVRAAYRFRGGRFAETGPRQRDTRRMVYVSSPRPGPRTARADAQGIVYTDSAGMERRLTTSSSDREPSLSSDFERVAFLRATAHGKEIWTVATDGSNPRRIFGDSVTWRGVPCRSSGYRSPRWSGDGNAILFVTDCNDKTGALWRVDHGSGEVAVFIPDAVLFGVIQSGKYHGHIIANQLTARTSEDSYPTYPFFMFSPEGKMLRRVGDEVDELESILEKWEGR